MQRLLLQARLIARAALLVVAGCAEEKPDPASQDPATLEPGLYNITVSHGIGPYRDGKEKSATHCVRAAETGQLPYTLAEAYFNFGACRTTRSPRVGNAVSGEIACAADPKMATGANRFVYEGAVSEDGVTLEARWKLEAEVKPGAGGEVSDAQLRLAMKAMERMKSVITARRTGDCG